MARVKLLPFFRGSESNIAKFRIAFKVCTKELKKLINFGGTKDASSTRGRPEIDRIQLRQMLLDSLPDGLIRWDYHLKSVEDVNGVINLHFRDQGVETGFDLVIGAEGAWSKVRSALSDDKPFYSGISGVSWTILNPQERCPDLYELVNKGSMFAFGESKSIMAQQLGDGRLNVSTWIATPEEEKKFDNKTEDAVFVKKEILAEYKGWHPQLLKFIELADGPFVPRSLYMLPIGNTWKHRPRMTVLGDAAHVMTPFAGEGVNLAMSDAMSLATAISNATKFLSTSTSTSPSNMEPREVLSKEVKGFEEDMFVRARKYQQMTWDMMAINFFTPGAPEATIEKWIICAAGHDMNLVLLGLFKAVVYTYFFFWRRWNGVAVKGWFW
jgi:2-polyprenyl-6-methoxyphenol hydroxylase-like FAD-dependent oxidoreductase